MNIKKVKLIDEVISALENDTTMSNIVDHMKCVCYAPHLGYRNWVFKYKSMYLLMFDEGNGHYQYICPLRYFDVLMARLSLLVERIDRSQTEKEG